MGRNFIVHDENPAWWHLWKDCQKKNVRVRETQDRVGCKIDTTESFSELSNAAEWKMHREPEIFEAETQVEELLDCRAWIASKELAPINLWRMGSTRVLVLQVRKWRRFGWKVLLCTPPGWWTAQRCSGYDEEYTTIGLRVSRHGAAEVYNDFAVKITKTLSRHANIRHQNPSLGYVQVNLMSVAQRSRRKQSGKS